MSIYTNTIIIIILDLEVINSTTEESNWTLNYKQQQQTKLQTTNKQTTTKHFKCSMSLGCLSLKYWLRMTTMPLARGSNPCHTRTLTRTVKRTVGRVPTALVYTVGHDGTHKLSQKRKQPYSYTSARAPFKGSTAIVTIASVRVSPSSRQNKRTKLLFAI